MLEYQLLELARESGAFDSDEEADRTINATLEALADCISRGELRDIAEPLSEHYVAALQETGATQPAPLDRDEFVDRVRSEADVEDAASKIRIVFAALAELVGEDELDDVRSQLPPEYGDLFGPATVEPGRTFVDVVAAESDLDADAAERAARATLDALGHRLSAGEADDLAPYLRGDASAWLTRTATHEAEPLSTDAFLARIARDAEVTEERARAYVDAVGDALVEAVPESERENAVAQLPDQYAGVLGLER
ncbi:MAG: DUF2267 domain-containing protein [Haloplanus sp.]